MRHVRGPVESTLNDLVYLRLRIEAIKRLAGRPELAQPYPPRRDTGPYALRCIEAECGYLLERIDQMRETLDPESTR